MRLPRAFQGRRMIERELIPTGAAVAGEGGEKPEQAAMIDQCGIGGDNALDQDRVRHPAIRKRFGAEQFDAAGRTRFREHEDRSIPCEDLRIGQMPRLLQDRPGGGHAAVLPDLENDDQPLLRGIGEFFAE